MGVPNLFPWLIKYFPNAQIHFQDGETNFIVDNLYLDSNGALHEAFQNEFNYGEHPKIIVKDDNLTYDEKVRRGFEKFFALIKNIIKTVTPTKRLYIAIDGPAPIAKQTEQRKRRYASVKLKNIKKDDVKKSSPTSPEITFNSNVITPGTQFMLELTKFMNYSIRKELNENMMWRNLEVIFSPPTVPGEGEHKCLEHIRSLPKSVRDAEKFCIWGPDGDLIMLTLATHLQHIQLFRKDQFEFGYLDVLDMGLVRKNLNSAMGVPHRTPDESIDDFILIGFFVGNDFLPKVRMFYMLQDGLNLMLGVYSEISNRGKINVLTTVSNGKKTPSFQGFKAFVNKVASYEKRYISDQVKVPIKDPRFKNETLLKHITKLNKTDGSIDYKFDFENYRIDYYEKCGIEGEKVEELIRNMCFDYLKSMFWVFIYYLDKLPSWTHFYRYHYAPLMTDLARIMNSLTSDEIKILYKFDFDQPSPPFVQLLTVLPPISSYLLPKPFELAFNNEKLKELGVYPDDFDVDYEGVTKEHMGVAKLPFVDVKVVKCMYDPIFSRLKNEYVRNAPGKNWLFKFDTNFLADYFSDYGNIKNLRVTKNELK